MANIDLLLSRALQLHQTGKLLEARAVYEQILKKSPTNSKALNLLGATYLQQREYQKGLPFIEKALLFKPDFLEAYNNLGTALKGLGRFEEAIVCYQKALALKPDYALAYYNLGLVLKQLNRPNEAIPPLQQAVKLKPDHADAFNHLGIVLSDAYRHEEAIDCFQKMLTLKPDYADGHNNLGIVLSKLRRFEAAIKCFKNAVAIQPDYVDAFSNLGIALSESNRHADATDCYNKLLSIKPDYPFIFGMYVHSKMHCCNWDEMNDNFHTLSREIDAGNPISTPFSLLATVVTPAQLKRCTEKYFQQKFPERQILPDLVQRLPHDKIRVGYFSADFHEHPVAKLTAELFERHDRSRFEVFGFSYDASPSDSMRQRLTSAFDHFIDLHNESDEKISALSRHLEIDIAIDLAGHTGNARAGIFALRAAPIQVNYLGYPGTSGSAMIDYLIADSTLIPAEHRQYYTEKIAYLPDTYFVNGSHRQMSERQFTRSEFDLPDNGFVFCCFNNHFKITPSVFDIWMQLLKQTEGSVLWLTGGNAQTEQNLRNEALKRCVSADRIVFAQRMTLLSEHLARHRLADLFLDTFFYNAHTTASDALWAGLPVLTFLGDTFASRVAASLLNAVGSPELITHSHEEYQARALELATHPDRLALIRQKLARNRLTYPLFNTELFTRNIEDAYLQMWERNQQSLLPEHLFVNARDLACGGRLGSDQQSKATDQD